MASILKPYTVYKPSEVEWLGDVPVHWKLRRGKTIFQLVDIRSKTGTEELLAVSSEKGIVPRSSINVTMFKAESYVGYKLCWPGDLVINSLWSWAQGLGVSKYHGIISSAYGVYRLLPKIGINPQYIHNLVRSFPFQWELQVRSKGIWISRLQLTDEAFLAAPFPFPPHNEQAAIVRYLDYVDGRIRRYISARKKLVQLLEEQKHALIHRAVIRGLDPNVRLKPSGVEWLGDMPAHWEVRRLRSIVKIINGATPTSDNPKFWDGSIAWLTPEDLGQLTNRYIKGGVRQITNEGYHACGTTLAPAGSIALSTRAPIGHIGILLVSACVNQGCRLLVPKKAIKSEYLYYELSVVRSELQSLGQGSTFTELSRVRLADFALNVPPLPEQEAITEYLDKAMIDFDTTIDHVLRQNKLLSEYRTRLIADVVTGKLDVREAAAKLPDKADAP